jgi:hypothetical protein
MEMAVLDLKLIEKLILKNKEDKLLDIIDFDKNEKEAKK